MSNWRLIRGAVFAALMSCYAIGAGACSVDTVTLQTDSGKFLFNISVADEPSEQAQGLMFVESMPRFSGMLFVYDSPVRATFWMKNTLIPLDMLFISPEGVVTNIHHMATPKSEATIDGGAGVLAVLEINGGLSKRLGITEGTRVQHPAFGPDAALPCAE